jgi:hypothetical protein
MLWPGFDRNQQAQRLEPRDTNAARIQCGGVLAPAGASVLLAPDAGVGAGVGVALALALGAGDGSMPVAPGAGVGVVLALGLGLALALGAGGGSMPVAPGAGADSLFTRVYTTGPPLIVTVMVSPWIWKGYVTELWGP